MEYIGEAEGFKLFKNKDGYLEGLKKVGKQMVGKENLGTDMKRVVTNQTTLAGFTAYVKGLTSSNKIKNIKLRPDQLPSLFNDNE